jgi:sugar phosphate isomerase/epimerase
MKLGILLPGRRPDDIALRLGQAREAGFGLCQLNFHQPGLTRADMVAVADAVEEYHVRPVAVGCYVNPLKPEDPGYGGATRADLDVVLHSLDILGARRVILWSGTLAPRLFDQHDANATEECLASLREFLGEVVRTTRARHYFLCIEPFGTHVLCDERLVAAFHETLEPTVAERVRYVVDAASFMTPHRYPSRDEHARSVCENLGPLAGVVHLRDCVLPPDGEPALPGPGQGRMDYPAYVESLFGCVADDVPAIIRNVPPAEFSASRDFLLQLTDGWELA